MTYREFETTSVSAKLSAAVIEKSLFLFSSPALLWYEAPLTEKPSNACHVADL
jgi:hypothetical protein